MPLADAAHILIVDDSATTRAVIRRTLSIAGVRAAAALYEAASGQAALDVLRANRVDLILADLHMPEMDGVEMSRRVLADPRTRSIPIVVVSAEPSDARVAELRAMGVSGFLRKPFTPEQVRDAVTKVMEACHA
jgi:two-component system chemotaxis response regulator CheY